MDVYDKDVTKIGREHIIGTYDVGDRLVPKGPIIRLQPSFWEHYRNITWLSICTETGEKGYIPITGMKIYYYRTSDYILQKQEDKIKESWYRWLPKSFLKKCEEFFENHPYKYISNFV